ncbi:hypothetical protein Pyn_06350 [Prunus yedoensis var. nudiflora]|uniref:Uncharacterized protein n=1 Tax=Prunus yedoensis var. nudiflora TaxID=2094558 RepID=A0A314UPZ7_PRUYE|nr:hypothetical protein Pyn_06350 [Prunus yedoensis var. nudiflora]
MASILEQRETLGVEDGKIPVRLTKLGLALEWCVLLGAWKSNFVDPPFPLFPSLFPIASFLVKNPWQGCLNQWPLMVPRFCAAEPSHGGKAPLAFAFYFELELTEEREEWAKSFTQWETLG